MADTVIFETGDALSQPNLGLVFARENITDYVEYGLGVSYNAGDDTIDVAAGVAHMAHNDEGVTVNADARSGLSVATTAGVNHVYLVANTASNNSVNVEVETSTTAFATPSLKLATVDTNSDTVTLTNQNPDAAFHDLTAETFAADTITVNGNAVYTTGDDLQADVLDSTTLVTEDVTELDFGTNMSVTDNGGGSVTVTAATQSSVPSASDNGTVVVSNPGDYNFGSNLTVTDDGDDTVTIAAASGTTVSDDGTEVLGGGTSVSDINFGTDLGVTNDGDGTVTVDASASGGGVDVSDDGTQVVATASGINFGTDLVVTDDTDGTVTVDANATAGDTRVDVSEAGTQVLAQPTDINFIGSDAASVAVTDDGDGTVSVDVAATDTDTHTDVSNDGTTLVADVDDINAGSGLTATDDTDGTVTLAHDGTATTLDGYDSSEFGVLNESEAVTATWNFQAGLQQGGNAVLTTADDVEASASDDGSVVVGDPSDFNFGTDLGVTDDGDGTVTVDAAGTLTHTDTAETVTAAWTFEENTTFIGGTEDGGDGKVAVRPATANLQAHVKHEHADGTDAFSVMYDESTSKFLLWDYTAGSHVFEVSEGSDTMNVGATLQENGNDVLTTADQDVAVSNTVVLSGGTATVSTGITTTGTHIDVRLDPSGGGANAADVKVAARAFWDNAAGEYKVEILEDGTAVGNPTVGYEIISS